MRRTICSGLLAITLCLIVLGARAHAPQPPRDRGAWYELLLKKFNPSDFDYGRWLEERRKTFIQATLNEPLFWYSLLLTIWSVCWTALCGKLFLDNRRRMRATAEMMADIYSHDLHSREVAKEAIEKHNRHIEQCNRAAEALEGAQGRPGWGETHIDRIKSELQRVTTQLEATTRDRNKLQEELRQKSLVVSHLSTRLDNLAKKLTGSRDVGGPARTSALGDGNEDRARFVSHINRLQEDLYAERQKNKRLKGA